MPLFRPVPPPPHFPVGGPVPAADLVGRETIVRRIASRLLDGNHLVLAGPRRIGKTSMVLEALRRAKRRGAITAYVDVLGVTDLRGLAAHLADAVLEGAGRIDRAALLLPLERERSASRLLEEALDLPRAIASRTGKRVVVAYDEFQAAGRLGPRVFDVMRARLQAQRGVSYAFLGSEEGLLTTLFGERGRAFYRFAVPIDLSDAAGHRFGIDPVDWLAYLRTKFRAKRIAIGEAEVDRMLDLTGGHPQDTMQLCSALYDLAREEKLATVGGDAVAVAYEQAMRELERPFALHWDELRAQKYLTAVAKRVAHGAPLYSADGPGGPVPRAEVLRALESLRARGLVVRLGRGRYEFVEPMLAEHVRRFSEREAIVAHG